MGTWSCVKLLCLFLGHHHHHCPFFKHLTHKPGFGWCRACDCITDTWTWTDWDKQKGPQWWNHDANKGSLFHVLSWHESKNVAVFDLMVTLKQNRMEIITRQLMVDRNVKIICAEAKALWQTERLPDDGLTSLWQRLNPRSHVPLPHLAECDLPHRVHYMFMHQSLNCLSNKSQLFFYSVWHSLPIADLGPSPSPTKTHPYLLLPSPITLSWVHGLHHVRRPRWPLRWN